MTETADQQPIDTTPVKSEETLSLAKIIDMIQLQACDLRRVAEQSAFQDIKLQIENEAQSWEVAVNVLSTHTLVSNELLAEMERVIGEYGDTALWFSREEECAYEDVWNRSESGYEPAQLVLAKMKEEKNAKAE